MICARLGQCVGTPHTGIHRSPRTSTFTHSATGGFTGFPALGIRWQRLESDVLKRAFQMSPSQKGVCACMCIECVCTTA